MVEITAVILPATDPSDNSYGKVPRHELVGIVVHEVVFASLVWYNCSVRKETERQIGRMSLTGHNILIGFSKSGLGALNYLIENPGVFQACIIFDSPVMRKECPPWETEAFYDQASWSADLPTEHVDELIAISQQTKLVLVSGEFFCDEMLEFSQLLSEGGGKSQFFDLHFPHRWDSGWLQTAISAAYP